MIYKAKLYKSDIFTIVYFFLIIIELGESYHEHDKSSIYFWLIVLIIIASVIVPRVFFVVYCNLFKKPALTVNEFYIFDHYKNVKYYWVDINEVIASDSFLEMVLFNPDQYFGKIINLYFRCLYFILFKIPKRKKTFKISLDLVDIKKGENSRFVTMINEYSKHSINNEKI